MTDKKKTPLAKFKKKTLAHLKGDNQINSPSRKKWKEWVERNKSK